MEPVILLKIIHLKKIITNFHLLMGAAATGTSLSRALSIVSTLFRLTPRSPAPYMEYEWIANEDFSSSTGIVL